MKNCKTCGMRDRIPGEHYDSRDEYSVKDANHIIKVAVPTNEMPSTVQFLTSSPQLLDGDNHEFLINVKVIKYVRLDRLSDPLRKLVEDLLDVET